MKLTGRWFPQILVVDRDSGNLCPIYIYSKNCGVSEPVRGRSRATELPCLFQDLILYLSTYMYLTFLV